MRSIQGADIVLPEKLFGELWTVETLERLARTYWGYLTHVTLGLIRVYYTDQERYVCLLIRPLKLLTFQAPEYETDSERGIVRWRIDKGLLVATAGRGGDGYLEIDVTQARLRRARPGADQRRGRGRELLPADRVAARAGSSTPTRSRGSTSS